MYVSISPSKAQSANLDYISCDQLPSENTQQEDVQAHTTAKILPSLQVLAKCQCKSSVTFDLIFSVLTPLSVIFQLYRS
jgi:hypothetical protein